MPPAAGRSQGRNGEEAAQAHVEAPLIAPRRIQPALPEALETVIIRCLEKDPSYRYANGRELVRALEGRACGDEPDGGSSVRTPAATSPLGLAWVIGGVVAVVAILLILWAAGVFTTKVPRSRRGRVVAFEGDDEDRERRLEAGAVSDQTTTGKAQGTVLSQTPEASVSVKEGSVVDMVAVGTSLQVVPNVLGMTQSEASTALTQAGLKLGDVAKVYSSQGPKGTVAVQAPAAGLEVESGSAVAVAISQGPKPPPGPAAVAVPDVSGQTRTRLSPRLRLRA